MLCVVPRAGPPARSPPPPCPRAWPTPNARTPGCVCPPARGLRGRGGHGWGVIGRAVARFQVPGQAGPCRAEAHPAAGVPGKGGGAGCAPAAEPRVRAASSAGSTASHASAALSSAKRSGSAAGRRLTRAAAWRARRGSRGSSPDCMRASRERRAATRSTSIPVALCMLPRCADTAAPGAGREGERGGGGAGGGSEEGQQTAARVEGAERGRRAAPPQPAPRTPRMRRRGWRAALRVPSCGGNKIARRQKERAHAGRRPRRRRRAASWRPGPPRCAPPPRWRSRRERG